MRLAIRERIFGIAMFFLGAVFLFLPNSASATTIFSDNFSNDYGELSTHTPTTTGTSWSLLTNNGVLLYNQSYNSHVTVQSNTANAGSFYTAEGTYSGADYEISSTVTFSAGDSNYTRTMAVRVQDINNMYFLRYGGNAMFRLYKRVSGTITQLGTASVTFHDNLSSPYHSEAVTLSVVGTTLTAKVDGVTKIEVTDSDITATGKAGIGLGYVTVSTDDGGTGVGIDDVVVQTTSVDSIAPTVTSVSSDKANGSYATGEAIDIDVTFSEAVTSTGNVTVTLETGTTDRTCTFTVTNATTGTCNYTVQAGDTSSDLTVSSISGTIADQASNAMTDFTPTTNLATNKALVVDTVSPALSVLFPADGATGISVTANLVLTFDAAVNRSTGNILIKKTSDDSTVETIDVTSGQVTGSGTAIITINPSVTLASETSYYVTVAATTFDDLAGNSYAGITDTTTWNFTTADVENPAISTLSPVDGATDTALLTNLVMTFNEAVDRETGNILIKKTSDDSMVETIDVTSGQVTGSGTAIITVNPSVTLAYGTSYSVTVDATAFDDPSGNSYAGITDTTTWNFTTVAEPAESNESLEVYDVDYAVTETTLIVTWKTNNDADSRLRYGIDRNMKKEKSDSDNEKKHEMTLKDLNPDTLYYFRVSSEDENDSEDNSRVYSVATKKKEVTVSLVGQTLNPTEDLPVYQELPVTVDEEPRKVETIQEEIPTFNSEETPQMIRAVAERQYATEVFKQGEQQYIKEVRFQILSKDGAPLPYLPVTLHSDPRTGVTDETGIVTFLDVPTGEHELVFSYAGEERTKQVAIADLKEPSGLVKAEVIVIRAERDALPVWVWVTMGLLSMTLLLSLGFSLWVFRKKEAPGC